jgi:hypothetical protein
VSGVLQAWSGILVKSRESKNTVITTTKIKIKPAQLAALHHTPECAG